MMTLEQREQRLTDFIRDGLPAFRVVPSLRPYDEARRRGVVHLPEIRILPVGNPRAGVLRWRLEITNDSPGTDEERRIGDAGLPAAAEAVQELLALPHMDHPWRYVSSGPLASVNGASRWEIVVEEADTPHGIHPQALFARAEPYGNVAGESIPAGTNAFSPTVTNPGASTEGATVVVLHDFAGIQHLGPVVEAGGTTLVTTRATDWPLPPPVHFFLLHDGIAAHEAAAEEERRDESALRRLNISLSGLRHRNELLPEQFELSLMFSILGRHAARAWRMYLHEHRERASLLLVRGDGSLVEVSLLGTEMTFDPTGFAARMRLRFLAGPVLSFAPFQEET